MNKTVLMMTAGLGLFLAPTVEAKEIDLKASSFRWTGMKKVGSGHNGRIFLNSAKPGSGEDGLVGARFVMNMKTFTVDDIEGASAIKLRGHLASNDFFDAEKHPTATLELTKRIDGDTVAGRLTIKGKTQDVKIDFNKKQDGTYAGRLVFDRTRFGLVYGSSSFFKSLVADRIIEDQVQVDFEVVVR